MPVSPYQQFAQRSLFLLARGLLLCAVTGASLVRAPADEFRAFWVDAWGGDVSSSSRITTLINEIRAANCNAVVPEIRKRGDAYYTPDTSYVDYEPKASDITPASFDPLQDLINKAHDTSGGKQRIEVHAWIVTYPIRQGTTYDSNPQHPYNRHPEWRTMKEDGTVSTANFDPGHPGVLEHTFRISMGIITNYDVDGFNFDYVRYMDKTNGYNPVAVSRFNARFGRAGTPVHTDPDWLQWRREQVTALVRKVYLNAIAAKPHVKISADTITWSPGPTSDLEWTNSARPYIDVLQDWRSWMEEGILDFNLPMAYFRQTVPAQASDYVKWMNFAKDRRFDRHLVIGPGIYLNSVSNAIHQMRATRAPSPSGNYADGVCGYVYKQPNSNIVYFSTFHTYLTNTPNAYDTSVPALFHQKANIPVMPWKTAPTKGHLKGMVYGGGTTNPLDGAALALNGPVNRSMISDGTGFYGSVDLPVGSYTLTASNAGFNVRTTDFTVSAGVVTTRDLVLAVAGSPVIVTNPQSRAVAAGDDATFTVVAEGNATLRYQWRFSGTNLAGATESAYTRPNAQTNHAGSYSVVVTNALGAVTSSVAKLTVTVPQFSDIRFSTNGSLGLAFSGVDGRTYLVEWSTNLANWLPLTTVPGNGGPVPVTDPDAPNYAWRFYRARHVTAHLIADFEGLPLGATALFRHPSFSGTTSSYVDTSGTVPNYTWVTNGFPAGHASAQVLHAAWTFQPGVSNFFWLRLTSHDAANVPNPIAGLQQAIRFDALADKDVYLAYGLRETDPAGGIGENGGTSGPIEWLGGLTDNTTFPPTGRLIRSNQWTTVHFWIPYDPIRGFTGNGGLDSTTGKGVWEELTIVPGSSGYGPYNLYLDNFQFVDLLP